MEYSGECTELNLANEDIIQEVVNIGVYRVNLEQGNWEKTIAFDILVNGMFSFKINVWNGDELLETEEVSGSITGLNNDVLLFEPNQVSTYEITSSDIGTSDARNMTLSYETNVSFTWSIPSELPMADIEDDLTVTVNNSNLATETALRIRVASNNNYNLVNSESGESLTYIITDQSSNLIKNDDVILDHIYNQETTSNSLHFKLTQMPVLSGKYEDTLTFTASVERMLQDLYSGQVVTLSNLGTTHNLTNMKIYGVSKQDGTPTPDNPVEIQSVVNPSVKMAGKNLLNLKPYDMLETVDNNWKKQTLDFLEPNKTYYLSGKFTTGEARYVYLMEDDTTIIPWCQNSTVPYNRAFTVKEGKKYSLNFYNNYSYDVCYDMQIELGSVATEYEPYKGEQTATLPYTLNAIPVSEGGNVTVNGQQYMSDYVDIENKKLVRMVKYINISSLDKSYWLFRRDITSTNATSYHDSTYDFDFNSYCNAVSNIMQLGTGERLNTFRLLAKNGFLYQFHLDKEQFPTVEDWTNYLTNNDVYIIYELATPVETDLTDEQVQAFKDLYTYSPTTVVSCSSDQLTPYIEFSLS